MEELKIHALYARAINKEGNRISHSEEIIQNEKAEQKRYCQEYVYAEFCCFDYIITCPECGHAMTLVYPPYIHGSRQGICPECGKVFKSENGYLYDIDKLKELNERIEKSLEKISSDLVTDNILNSDSRILSAQLEDNNGIWGILVKSSSRQNEEDEEDAVDFNFLYDIKSKNLLHRWYANNYTESKTVTEILKLASSCAFNPRILKVEG